MRSKRDIPEVELTSLVDIIFQLILFFVIATTFVEGGITVALPKGKGDSINDTPVVINVNHDGAIIFNGRAINIDEAVHLAQDAKSKRQTILLAGDRSAPYGKVVNVLDALKQAGIDEVSLAVGGGESSSQ